MDSEHKEYNQIKEKQLLLAELAGYINTINLQDSQQTLAGLSEGELSQVINKIIAAEQKKELEKQQQERQRANQRFESNRFEGRENNFGQKTSGGKWYFYNPRMFNGTNPIRKLLFSVAQPKFTNLPSASKIISLPLTVYMST